MQALPPANEDERLRVLREYHVLDTDAEESFDEIVRLAARLCETPAAILTLIDESRQWFKSCYGLSLRETHRDVAFCAHTILTSHALLVPDASGDPRFRDNPLVTGSPGIRFYAGVPLMSPEGLAVGSLAVIDFTPRDLTREQIEGLQTLTRHVMAQLELRRAMVRETARASLAEASLQTASAHHRVIFESALDAIVIMDAAGRVEEFNTAAEKLFGYARADAIGRTMADLIVPDEYRDQHVRGLARYLSTGEAGILGRRIETTAMRRDRSRLSVELTVQRLGREEPAVFVGFIRDITERTRAAQELHASTERYWQQRHAITRLIQDERLYHRELHHALRQITEAVATTLCVPRVSVWQYVADRSVIRCLDLYDRPEGRHSSGVELSGATAAEHFETLGRVDMIGAPDAPHDPRTLNWSPEYVRANAIGSVLDAPVHLHGSLHGVLRLEPGARREWTPDEETFAVAAANLASLALEGDQRRRAQDALVAHTEMLTAVMESLAAYVERGDWNEAFSRLLRCALSLTNSRSGLIGVIVDGPEIRVLAHEGAVWDAVIAEPAASTEREKHPERYWTLRTDSPLGRTVSSGAVVITSDPAGDLQAMGDDAPRPLATFLGVPIRGQDEAAGLIALADRPGGYGPDETTRIQSLVRQAAALCKSYRQRERARLHEHERQEAEAARRASDERLRVVARATNDTVWEWDVETDTVFVPEGFRKLFGDDAEQQDITWDMWFSRVHSDDQARIDKGRRSALDGGADVWSDEYRFRRPNGTYADVFDRGYVLRNEQGRPVRMIGAMMDISNRKQLEAQFRQAQKLEAVGQLAGGVAHDFNNILTVIKGHASLLRGEGQQTPLAGESIRQIDEAAERAAGLTRQLLAFSRKQILQATDLDMNVVVSKMVRLLERLLGEQIRLRTELSATPTFVRADASMMEQILLNLAINARDAMPDGGRLVLTTAAARLESRALPEHPDARPGEFVRVSVSDSGSGIAPDVLPHIFEPFFTTKGPERGTGLGLATVYGVVKQHLGFVTVQSVRDAGTTFDVYLPALAHHTTEAVVAARGALDERGTETVLLVEDETSVRRLARVLLERRGYTVLEADSGPAALSVWRRERARIDLLVTDMVMPDGLTGLQLADQLRTEQPDLRVIVTSGYSIDLAGKQMPGHGRLTFLAKPYSVHDLLYTVRETLDGTSGPQDS